MYEIYFNKLRLPVAPKEVQMKIQNQNETLTLISGREINLAKLPGLTEVEFDCLLPAVRYPFAVYPDGFCLPDFYINAFEKLKIDKQPFRLIINRRLPGGQHSFDTNLPVLLEEYAIREAAEEGFDVTVSVRLKEYVDFKTVTYQADKQEDGTTVLTDETPRASDKVPAKTYEVKSGDSLWAICKRELGDGSRYAEIARLNGIKNPSRIYPGQVIRFA